MLIRFREKQRAFNFSQLYWQTTHLLAPVRWQKKTAVVLGPISNKDPAIVTKNLLVLRRRARELSQTGLNVLDITSYHQTIERLVVETNVAGYPFSILEDFTLPLIREGWFNVIHFRQPFLDSVGTLREYEVATENRRLHRIDIIGF